jgi:hypothetical protein
VENLESVVKINYIVEIPINEAFEEEYLKFLDSKGKTSEGMKNYLVDQFLSAYLKPVIDTVKEEYKEFDGKFVMNIRSEWIKGIFQGRGLVRGSLDEPLREEFEKKFKELLKTDNFRVDINLGCMI